MAMECHPDRQQQQQHHQQDEKHGPNYCGIEKRDREQVDNKLTSAAEIYSHYCRRLHS